MAFFDKLTSVTKNAAAGAGDMIEITKLKAKIGEENKRIENLKTQIGDFYWQQAAAGQQLATEAADLAAQIQAALSQIDSYNAEIASIKAPDEFAAPTAAYTPAAPTHAAAAAAGHCPACGAAVVGGVKFCPSCGQAIPQETNAVKLCSGCGAKLVDDSKFCPECGCPTL